MASAQTACFVNERLAYILSTMNDYRTVSCIGIKTFIHSLKFHGITMLPEICLTGYVKAKTALMRVFKIRKICCHITSTSLTVCNQGIKKQFVTLKINYPKTFLTAFAVKVNNGDDLTFRGNQISFLKIVVAY